ncbi:hypothetical protein BSPWISOXPB_5228 [uncultured Gammaproteobacteria bacterium]|nr:hypothetical protein BSPWISOXPB_5228 [uncultured Gammaproteobacteria bacterium]
MAKRAPKAQITDYDREYLSKLLEQSTANARKATEQANKLEIKISKYNAYSEYYTKLATKLLEGSDLLNEDAQKLRDNATLLDELSNKLEQKAQYFKSLADNASMKAYMGSGFTPLVVQRNKALYFDIAERLTKQAQLYLNAQGEERQILVNQIANEYDDYAEILIEQAEQATQEATHWQQVAANTRKSHNKNHYQAMLDDTNNIYFYRIRSRDAAGRLTGHIVGNGLSTEQDFSPASGHLYTIKSNFNSVDEIRNLEYEYDLMDNVTQRQNHISGLSEGFIYDALDRLTQSSTTGKIDDVDYSYAVDYKYDINGNITNKSDVGDYSYNAVNGVNSTHPHTPNSIAGLKTHTNNQDRTYTYDANGSMTKNGNKSITWTSFNKPKQFTKGTDSTTFTYGPDRSRYQKVQTRSSDNTTITTQYFGKVYEQIKQNTNTEHKHFIYLDKQLIAIHIKTDTTSTADTADTTNTPATPSLTKPATSTTITLAPLTPSPMDKATSLRE